MPIKILLIDDDPAALLALSEALRLRMAEVRVDTALSGPVGLDLLTENVYDCVMCDVVMPGLGGIEVLTKVRQRWPTVPVVLVTAGDSKRCNEISQQGLAVLLHKPLDIDAVVNVIRLIVQRSRESGRGESS